MKYIFIVNPISGKGKGLKFTENIQRTCTDENLEYVIHYTKASGDATRIAEKYKDEENIIYSVGGDGTLSEVVNGIVGTKNMLGVLPGGSGNDFYKTLINIKEELPIVDIGKVNDRYFINIACIGIDAEIANNLAIMKKARIPTSQLYNFSIIYTFLKFKPPNIRFTFNGYMKEGRYTILSICNGKYYGGGYKIAPNASLNDGMFDLYYVDYLQKIKIPSLFFKIIKGTHESSEYIHKENTSFIEIKTEEIIGLNIDGETMYGNTFNIEVIENAIRIYNNVEFTKKIINNSEKYETTN